MFMENIVQEECLFRMDYMLLMENKQDTSFLMLNGFDHVH
jgi:hypothetical protein